MNIPPDTFEVRPDMADVIRLRMRLTEKYGRISDQIYGDVSLELGMAFEHSDSMGYLSDKGVEHYKRGLALFEEKVNV